MYKSIRLSVHFRFLWFKILSVFRNSDMYDTLLYRAAIIKIALLKSLKTCLYNLSVNLYDNLQNEWSLIRLTPQTAAFISLFIKQHILFMNLFLPLIMLKTAESNFKTHPFMTITLNYSLALRRRHLKVLLAVANAQTSCCSVNLTESRFFKHFTSYLEFLFFGVCKLISIYM